MEKLTEQKALEILNSYMEWQNSLIDKAKKDMGLNEILSTSPEMLLNPFRFMRFAVWLSVNYPDYYKDAKILHKNLCRCYKFVGQ